MQNLLGVLVVSVLAVGHAVPTAKQMRSRVDKATRQDDCTEYPCLIFEDNFDSLDFTKWDHEVTAGGGGNWEFQYYTNNRTNSYVRDGRLFIKPTLTEDEYGPGFLSSGTLSLWGHQPNNLCSGNAWWGCERLGTPENYINPVASARLRTPYSFNFRYGRIDVTARMPKGDWLWPAIWMLPRFNEYGEWPASGEIDLVESRGNLDYLDEEGNQMGHTHASQSMHWGPFWPYNAWEMTTGSIDGDFADSMHTYTMIWDQDHIEMYIDLDQLVYADPGTGFWEYGGFDQVLPPESNPWMYGTKMAPFDAPFYIVMNVAVGGTNGFFSDEWTNVAYPKPWLNTSPTGPRDFWEDVDLWYPTWVGEEAAMEVDSVTVYKLQADP